MHQLNLKRSFLLVAVLAVFSSYYGSAATISGSLWRVPDATSKDAVPANIPATTPDVTFDVLSPFDFSGNGVSIGTWLGSSGAFNITENTAGTLSALMSNGSISTLVDFHGFVTVVNGQQFTVTHDDGLTLIINGVDLGFNAGPTSPTQSTATYNGASGTFPFELVYGECCGGPAVLQVELPFSNTRIVPETSSTLALLALSLSGLILGVQRFRRVRA